MLTEFSEQVSLPYNGFFFLFFQMFNLLIRFSNQIHYCITAVVLWKSNLKSAIDILACLDSTLQ